MMRDKGLSVVFGLSIILLAGCATETSRTIEAPQVNSASSYYKDPEHPFRWVSSITVQVISAVFSDGVDRLGNQAKTTLVTHLQQSNRFTVLDRTNMGELQAEANIQGKQQNLKGAHYVITGDVTEFGRKEVGDHQLFGILGRAKSQVAYAKVNLNIVNVNTSEVVYSVQGAGEYALSNREIIGFGGTASYDSTLNGKVLDLAIREAVNHLVNGIDNRAWSPVVQ